MKKDLYAFEAMKEAGFTRRFTTSRGWPGSGRIRLKHSKGAGGPGWTRKDFQKGAQYEERGPADLLEKVGPPNMLEVQEARRKRYALKRLERKVNGQIIREKVVADSGRVRERSSDVRDIAPFRDKSEQNHGKGKRQRDWGAS